jgi:surfactin synthase thioesterase subunit
MISDAPVIFKAFANILNENHYCNDIFVLGRSLGSASAIEIAYRCQKQLTGTWLLFPALSTTV